MARKRKPVRPWWLPPTPVSIRSIALQSTGDVLVSLAIGERIETLRCDVETIRSYDAFRVWIRHTYGDDVQLVPSYEYEAEAQERWLEHTEALRVASLVPRPRPPRWLTWLHRRFQRAPLRVLP